MGDWSWHQQLAALDMLEELKSMRLVVAKIRTDTGWVRIAITSNPWWYSAVCKQHMRNRKRYPKYRTLIRRCRIESVLTHIAEGTARADGLYAGLLKEAIKSWMIANYERDLDESSNQREC